jgi:adenylate cyclase
MAKEIERKFLVREGKLPDLPKGDELEQGYLSAEPAVRVRLAVRADGTRHGELTIKGKGLLSRAEFNYPIPADDAVALLDLCATSLRKVRHRVGRWEIDHFEDRGLWLAEIELQSEDEPFERPAWLGEEVTHEARYSNVRLATARPSK